MVPFKMEKRRRLCSAITVINMNVKAEHNLRGMDLFINTKKLVLQ